MPRRGGINARLAYDFFRFLKRPQYDRFTVLPAGLSLASAIAAANEAIQQANKEDHDSEDGTCADGDNVEGNVRRRLEALGFSFLPVEITNCWDQYVEQAEVAHA